jgi:hypothetical protein
MGENIMIFIVKNLQENKKGNVSCQLLQGETWSGFTMPLNAEYEIHVDSEWPDIKPCDPVTKDAYEAKQAQDLINQEAMAYLDHTDKFFTRLSETGKAMPEGMAEARSAARERIVF